MMQDPMMQDPQGWSAPDDAPRESGRKMLMDSPKHGVREVSWVVGHDDVADRPYARWQTADGTVVADATGWRSMPRSTGVSEPTVEGEVPERDRNEARLTLASLWSVSQHLSEMNYPRLADAVDSAGALIGRYVLGLPEMVADQRERQDGDRTYPMTRIGYLEWLSGRDEGHGDVGMEPIASLAHDGFVELIRRFHGTQTRITDTGRKHLESQREAAGA